MATADFLLLHVVFTVLFMVWLYQQIISEFIFLCLTVFWRMEGLDIVARLLSDRACCAANGVEVRLRAEGCRAYNTMVPKTGLPRFSEHFWENVTHWKESTNQGISSSKGKSPALQAYNTGVSGSTLVGFEPQKLLHLSPSYANKQTSKTITANLLEIYPISLKAEVWNYRVAVNALK